MFWSSAPLGAVALALIHETTGGRWGAASTPILRLGCVGALFLPLFLVVLLPGLHLIYPWARGDAPAPDVAHVLLNAPAFAACGLVALVVWAIIGLLLAGDRMNLLGAALALVFHGVAVSVVAVVWMLSLDPGFTNSAFGAELAVQQIMLALALVASLMPERAIALAKGDIGALLFATSLGAFYLSLMTFVVKWYGDQPEDAGWYLARAHGLPFALLIGALVFGAVIPIIGCAWERVRLNARPLRAVGLSAISASSCTTSGSRRRTRSGPSPRRCSGSRGWRAFRSGSAAVLSSGWESRAPRKRRAPDDTGERQGTRAAGGQGEPSPEGLIFALLAAAGLVLLYRPRSRNPATRDGVDRCRTRFAGSARAPRRSRKRARGPHPRRGA